MKAITNMMGRTAVAAALMLAAGTFTASQASAAVIVYTGPDQTSWGYTGRSLYSGQALGVRFTLGQTTTITGVEGFLQSYDTLSGVAASLHASNGAVMAVNFGSPGGPKQGPGTLLYTTSFDVPTGTPAFHGSTGLSWLVGPGDYWLVFASGNNLAMGHGPDNPSVIEANKLPDYPWTEQNQMNLVIRIQGDAVAAIPEPGTWAMMIGGFGLVGGAMRRRARKAAIA